jgi:hypothetical protein
VLAVSALAAPTAGASSITTRPNIVLVMTDYQGYGDLSAHGNPVLKTPQLDRLRAESIRLTEFHVTPMCTRVGDEMNDRPLLAQLPGATS